ncbi:MAG: hypothetical protein AAF544_12965 [Bacteroidota bacterium]
MKTAKIVFISACVFICVWPVFRITTVNAEYQREGDQASFVLAEKARFFDTIFVEGPIVEESHSIGFVDRIRTSAGFHLIHDPSLSGEYILSGPRSALDHVASGNAPFDDMSFRFDRPMIMDEPVEVRINLNANNPGIISLDFDEHGGSNTIPSFTALGPLEAKVVVIRGCAETDGPIEVYAEYLYQSSDCPGVAFSGEVGRIETRIGENTANFDDLSVQVIDLDMEWPGGRTATFDADSVHIWYGFDRQDRNNIAKLMEGAPDTIYLPADAGLEVDWRHDRELTDLDTALIVRKDF